MKKVKKILAHDQKLGHLATASLHYQTWSAGKIPVGKR